MSTTHYKLRAAYTLRAIAKQIECGEVEPVSLTVDRDEHRGDVETTIITRPKAPRRCVGQRYRDKEFGRTYILASVGVSMVALVCLEGGNRFRDPVRVDDVQDISPVEWEKIAGVSRFERIEEQ